MGYTGPRPKGKNRYDLDANYFHKNLCILARDIDNYPPEDLRRALLKLADAIPAKILTDMERSDD